MRRSDLSRQANTWLNFFISNPDVRINYTAIMEHGGVSRRRSLDIIRELRAARLITAKRSRYIGTNLELTSTVSSASTVTAVQLLQPISNSSNARTTDIATNKFFDGVEGEEKQVGYDFFESTSSEDDEFKRERAKHLAAVKQEHAEMKLAQAEKRRDRHRSKIDPTLWSCKDVAYEFADRMADLWTIAPFSVTQSRFVQALSVFRKQHDTNGALELELIDLFFTGISAEKYTDGNHLWRAFLYKAPLLLQTARERVVTVEERETAIIKDAELTSKKLSLFDEDDDV